MSTRRSQPSPTWAWTLGMIVIVLAVCVAARLVSHPPNFTPIAAAAMFVAFIARSRRAGVAIALGAMFITDALLGFYQLPLMLAVYGCLAAPAVLGPWVGRRLSVARVLTGATGSAILFFVVTNFVVWAQGGIYPPTIAGLVACLIAAIPFFKFMLAGNVLWSGVMFGGYALLPERTAVQAWRRT